MYKKICISVIYKIKDFIVKCISLLEGFKTIKKDVYLTNLLAHLWCAYAIPLCQSWIMRRAVGGVCVKHNYPEVRMD